MISLMRSTDPPLSAGFATDYGLMVRDVEIAVRDRTIVLSIVTPPGDIAPETSRPCIFFIHGGGMMWGNRYSGLESMVEFVQRGAVCVSVEYSLAPEHPDPAPREDCNAALNYVADHFDELSVDPTRLLIAGISAGGGLAAGTALYCRDHQGPELCGQLLLAPMLDDRNETVSSVQFSRTGIWSRESNQTGWKALLGEAATGKSVSIYAAPARATDLARLPPTYLEVGSAEVFRDEVVRYAERMWQQGTSAELHVWSGGFHGFDSFAPRSGLALAALDARRQWVSRTLRLP